MEAGRRVALPGPGQAHSSLVGWELVDRGARSKPPPKLSIFSYLSQWVVFDRSRTDRVRRRAVSFSLTMHATYRWNESAPLANGNSQTRLTQRPPITKTSNRSFTRSVRDRSDTTRCFSSLSYPTKQLFIVRCSQRFLRISSAQGHFPDSSLFERQHRVRNRARCGGHSSSSRVSITRSLEIWDTRN